MSLDVERLAADLSSVPPNFAGGLKPGAPAPARMMAARGMLPLSPSQNILVLYTLALDKTDVAIGEIVLESVRGLPPEIIGPAIQGQTHEGVLDWLAEVRTDAAAIQLIVTNNKTHSNTIAKIAATADANLCEVIATNQVRILSSPQIIEQMYQNANARMATVDRLVELAMRNNVVLEGLPALRDAVASGTDIFANGEDPDVFQKIVDEQVARAREQESRLAGQEDLTRAERERLEKELDGDEEEEPEKRGNLSSQISNMSIAQKIRLCTVGGRDAIGIMIRDPNKLVHMAAIRSPRVKYADVAKWAKNKSMPDAVINHICMNRDWTRHYECMLNLVNNPKTPMSEAMGFLTHIRTNDLKSLQRNRNVPMQISRSAKTLFVKRSGGGGKKR